MADNTKIEWCDATWNPIVGCTPVGAGCANCYAAREATRMAGNPATPQYAGIAEGGRWTGQVRFVPHKLDEPLHWRKPRSIFVCSMSDLFHPEVTNATIDRVLLVTDRAWWHRYVILTKRIARAAEYLADGPNEYANVWIGPSVWDQASWDAAAPHVAALKNAGGNTVVSAEPLLGPIDMSQEILGPPEWGDSDNEGRMIALSGLEPVDALIVGGESGPGARPMHPDWPRSLRDQAAAGGVPFFFKQLGDRLASGLGCGDRHGRDPDEWPTDLRVRSAPWLEVADAE